MWDRIDDVRRSFNRSAWGEVNHVAASTLSSLDPARCTTITKKAVIHPICELITKTVHVGEVLYNRPSFHLRLNDID